MLDRVAHEQHPSIFWDDRWGESDSKKIRSRDTGWGTLRDQCNFPNGCAASREYQVSWLETERFSCLLRRLDSRHSIKGQRSRVIKIGDSDSTNPRVRVGLVIKTW